MSGAEGQRGRGAEGQRGRQGRERNDERGAEKRIFGMEGQFGG